MGKVRVRVIENGRMCSLLVVEPAACLDKQLFGVTVAPDANIDVATQCTSPTPVHPQITTAEVYLVTQLEDDSDEQAPP